MKLSVIIPTKNDERHIGGTVESVFKYLHGRGIEHEIIVVVNNSTDRTEEILHGLETSVPSLRVISYKGVIGKGHAVKTGMLAAKGDLRLFMDADNSTRVDQLEKMTPYLDQGYDVVIGSIAVKGKKVAAGSEQFWRFVMGKAGNLFIQLMAVPGIHDTQRGFKVMTARAADRIYPLLTIERFGFDIELLALARKFGYRIKEVGIEWANDTATSKVGLKSYLEVLWETVKVRWNLMTGAYH